MEAMKMEESYLLEALRCRGSLKIFWSAERGGNHAFPWNFYSPRVNRARGSYLYSLVYSRRSGVTSESRQLVVALLGSSSIGDLFGDWMAWNLKA